MSGLDKRIDQLTAPTSGSNAQTGDIVPVYRPSEGTKAFKVAIGNMAAQNANAISVTGGAIANASLTTVNLVSVSSQGGARSALGLGTIATQDANSVSISGTVNATSGSVQNVAITNCSNPVFGADASVMGGEGVNSSYQVTVNGGAAVALERLANFGSGIIVEGKLKRGATTPSVNDDFGLALASSWNDAAGVLRLGCRVAPRVSGTPISGAGGVGAVYDIELGNGAGFFGTHTRFNGVDGTTETRFKDSTARTGIIPARVVGDANGLSGATELNFGTNVLSVVRSSTGIYVCTPTFLFPSAEYVVLVDNIRNTANLSQLAIGACTGRSTTNFTLRFRDTSGNLVDVEKFTFTVLMQ